MRFTLPIAALLAAISASAEPDSGTYGATRNAGFKTVGYFGNWVSKPLPLYLFISRVRG